jgi:hypothetical protein
VAIGRRVHRALRSARSEGSLQGPPCLDDQPSRFNEAVLNEGCAAEQRDAADEAQGGTRTASRGAALYPAGEMDGGIASQLIRSVRQT